MTAEQILALYLEHDLALKRQRHVAHGLIQAYEQAVDQEEHHETVIKAMRILWSIAMNDPNLIAFDVAIDQLRGVRHVSDTD